MTLVFADLVQETTSTTGAGTLTLSGAVSGFQSFAAIGNTNTTYYRIKSGLDSEVGIGTYTLSGTTLSRDTVLYSSAGGTTKITVATGATVSCVYPAERAVYLDAVGNLGVGGASAVNKLTVADTVLATGSGAGSLVDLSQTWNNAAGNPTAIKLNVTNSQSGSTAKLMDLQVGGESKFSVSKTGNINFGSTSTQSLIDGVSNGVGNELIIGSIVSGVGIKNNVFMKTNYLQMYLNSFFGWSVDPRLNTGDLTLYRDAASTLAQRNSTNSQTFRLYNTYTDASNYERSALSFVTYSGALYTKLAAESAGTGAANIGIALSPKGTGAITAQVPDGTVAGGNARGANSVDLQTLRDANTQVAGGIYSAVLSGKANKATGTWSVVVGGAYCESIGANSLTGGVYCTADGQSQFSIAYGSACSLVNASYGGAFGLRGTANKRGQFAFGIGAFAIAGDMQYSYLGFAGATTTATTTEIFLVNSAGDRATIPNSTTWAADIDIVARSSGGTENAYFKRRLVVKKGTTAASTALVGTVQTVGTDIGTTDMLAIATPITLTADTTNGAMKLEVTGLAATNIRWVAKVSLVEVGFA